MAVPLYAGDMMLYEVVYEIERGSWVPPAFLEGGARIGQGGAI